MTIKKTVLYGLICLAGLGIAFFILLFAFDSSSKQALILRNAASSAGIRSHKVIGFLPYWLIDKADKDYTQYLTTLSYFSLTLSDDGSIKRFSKPGESEPGWYALTSEKTKRQLTTAKNSGVVLSLVVFNSDTESIEQLISDPASHAATLITEVAPLMKEQGFTDLNLDIESTDTATDGARINFTAFVRELKRQMDIQHVGTLTIDVSPTDLIKQRLIQVKEIGQIADFVLLMTYDYHFPGSIVTGPVAPLNGAGITLEFDTRSAIEKALSVIPSHKILLGLPLYGYQWETITNSPHAAVLPGSGILASNRRMESFLQNCSTCSAQYDSEANEVFVHYADQQTGSTIQVYFPDTRSMQQKLKTASEYQLEGVGLWALGYEGSAILDPLIGYKRTVL